MRRIKWNKSGSTESTVQLCLARDRERFFEPTKFFRTTEIFREIGYRLEKTNDGQTKWIVQRSNDFQSLFERLRKKTEQNG